MPKKIKQSKEPVFIVRPVKKNFGLDYLHISLIVLVIALVALAFGISLFKPGASMGSGCQYGALNGTCVTPIHNSSQALLGAERILASYGSLNSSLSLLPYYSLVNQSTVDYLPSQAKWYVSVPYINPLSRHQVFRVSFTLFDSNLSLATPYTQLLSPVSYTNNSVAGLGSVSISGRTLCQTTTPIPVYLITDPYSPGALGAISTAANATKQFGSQVNMSYYFVFGAPSIRFYKSFGLVQTQALGQYLSCASRQSNFAGYAANVSSVFTGTPISNSTLSDIAAASNLNTTKLNTCLANVSVALNYQAQLSDLYNLQYSPGFVVNCKYGTIPETLNYSIDYALGSLPGAH
ncbi:MAG: hypothetical protein KGH66_01330 [Candidatus Micrarchaeota archaeon]|nr:hypothetical protein [Candidatus Micrarchaeota archaeon]